MPRGDPSSTEEHPSAPRWFRRLTIRCSKETFNQPDLARSERVCYYTDPDNGTMATYNNKVKGVCPATDASGGSLESSSP
jgi:hypothetical protein